MHGSDNGPPGDAGLRVSDADRDAVVDQLAGHFQQGRLDLTEFHDRMDRAVRARTRGDLAGLLADLPQPGAAAPSVATPAMVGPPPAEPGRRWPVPLPVLAVLAVAGALILASLLGAAAHGPWAGAHWASGHWASGHWAGGQWAGHRGSGWPGARWAPWWAPWWALWWLIPVTLVGLRAMWWRRGRSAGASR